MVRIHDTDLESSKPKWQFWNRPTGIIKLHKAFLVVVVITGPQYLERRDAIRETWLKDMPEGVMGLFAIGTGDASQEEMNTLEYEKDQHKDLLLMPHVNESYGGLTTKLLETLIWLDKNVDYKFAFKADDDTFARMDVMKDELQKKKPERLYWGFFDGRTRVKRRGKWMEKDWILCDYYLPHALGGGYVLSADLVHFIAANSKYLQKFISEDVSLGTWLAPLDIDRVHDPRFDTEFRSRGCMNSYIVTHKQSIEQMREKHINLLESGKLCKKQMRTRYSYVYNWNVPPSHCCIRNDTKIP